MQHLRTDTGSSSPCLGKEDQTTYVHALLMTRTMMSHNSRIPASKGNPVSSVKAGGTGNTLSSLAS